MVAEIIAVGSEMLTPFRQDTNSLYLTEGLNELGIPVAFKTIIGDNRQHLVDAIIIALRRADVVLLSGGLGPTEDDLTRECVAEAIGVGLHRNEDALAALRQRFAERRMIMSANNQKQAEMIDGAVLLPNRNGSAPGQWLEVAFKGQRRILVLLPGPPKELKPLFDEQCKPRLASSVPQRALARRLLRMALIPESQVDARTAPIYGKFEDVDTTILSGSGEIQLHFTCVKPTMEEAQARVDELVGMVEHEMGDDIFSSQGESLEEVVLSMLSARELKLSVAESCTGGLLSQRFTTIPSASRAFHGGAIVYASEMKTRMCGVPWDLIQEKGAVSEEVARALAEGIRERSQCSLGISITGIAGPAVSEGPDAGKPVGLVYIGFADENGSEAHELHLSGDRDRIRLWSSQHALEILRRKLLREGATVSSSC